MPVLVTGAGGFLGGRLVQMLTERGERVRILARATSDLTHLAACPVELVRGDLHDAATVAEAVRGVTHVYHCAACSTDWAPWATYQATNAAGTAALAAAAAAAGTVERFVHVSTTDVYGYPRTPCDERAPLRDTGLPYNRTKIQGETAVWRAHREQGLPVTVVRPATIYGPRGKDFVVEIAAMLRQRMMLLIDGGRARGGFIYVDDVCRALMAAATTPGAHGRAYNLCGGTGMTWRAYTDALADALGERRAWLQMPFAAAYATGAAMEAAYGTLRLRSRPPLTRHATLLLGRDQEFPADCATQELHFRPMVTAEEGIARSAAWLRTHYDREKLTGRAQL